MADQNEEKKSRAVVSLISVGVVLIIGLPVWWNTTKVYRATLPHADIQGLDKLQTNIKIVLTIIFEQEDPRQKEFLDTLSKKLNFHEDETRAANFRFSVNGRESNAQEKQLFTSSIDDVNLEALDDSLQELWKSNMRNIEYNFVVLSQQGEFSKLAQYAQCFVGKYRHAIVLHNDNETHLAEVIANVTKNVFVQERVIEDAFHQQESNNSLQESIEQIRDLKAATGFHLSFSLINDEPETGVLNWNIKEAIAEILQPLITRIPYFDISVDSQILHYSGVNLKPKTDGEVNYLTTEDLPHMINPIERKLGSFVSLNPSLNFIVFVPTRKQTPLKIKDINGIYSPTNAFLSPRWGGVLIHNVLNRSEANGSTPQTIIVDMTSMMKVFLTQIRLLVGIKPVSSQDGVIISSVLNSGVRDWFYTTQLPNLKFLQYAVSGYNFISFTSEKSTSTLNLPNTADFLQEVDNLLLAKTMEYLSSSVKTITSLTQLMDKVKNMIIDDNIKTEIVNALLYGGQCQHQLSQGRVTHAFMSAKVAIKSSEKAFYDPSVLELLYFPDDQKFAIYIPLFLPMSLPLLVSLFAAIQWLRNKDNEENRSETAQSETDKDDISIEKKKDE